jgi:hypothetical protein
MRILVYSADPSFELPHAGKSPLDFFLNDVSAAWEAGADEADLIYLDRSGLAKKDFDRLISRLSAAGPGLAWGVLDPQGLVEDPAALFHQGACDYLGGESFHRGVDAHRWKRALAFHGRAGGGSASGTEAKPASLSVGSKRIEAPFPGWHALRPGEEREFYFLYAAPSDAAFLKSKIGETRFQAFKERFQTLMSQLLAEAEAQAWIRNDTAVLFLVPPLRVRAAAAVTACLRALLCAPLIGYERFGLEVPLSLTFALHRGSSPYQPPGRTGTLVSDDVNFIHHLGQKRAQGERLTVTETAAEAIPPELADLFVPDGCFEERELRRSRLFLREGSAYPRYITSPESRR